MNYSMVKIKGGKGFFMRFDNGWGVSVQFGPGNYCANYDQHIGRDEARSGSDGSPDAECALIDPAGELVHRKAWGDSVGGRMSMNEVLDLMNEAAAMPGVTGAVEGA